MICVIPLHLINGKEFTTINAWQCLSLTTTETIMTWMKDNTTGDFRIRTGVPKGWVVADKTGSGDYGITNDIAIIWPPNCAPIVVAIYFIQNKKDAPHREDIVASATRLILSEFKSTEKCRI